MHDHNEILSYNSNVFFKMLLNEVSTQDLLMK